MLSVPAHQALHPVQADTMKNLLFLALALPLVACSASSEPVTIETSMHNVKCGCDIDSVGACGTYVEFEGEYAELTNREDFGFGKMEWCHKDGLKAEVTGTLTDDKFVASSVEVKP